MEVSEEENCVGFHLGALCRLQFERHNPAKALHFCLWDANKSTAHFENWSGNSGSDSGFMGSKNGKDTMMQLNPGNTHQNASAVEQERTKVSKITKPA